MSWHVWLGFVAASLAIGLVPGPAVMSIVGYALGSGRRVALAAVAGAALGNLVAMSLSLAGVGALLAASALAFAVVKWTGALYLIGLGLITIARSGRGVGAAGSGTPARVITPRAAFLGNLTISTFHPKTIIFFVAFVPQFIGAEGNYPHQAALLVATFSLVVAATDVVYAVAASRAAHLLRRPAAAQWSQRAGGGVLVAAGIATAASRA